MNGGPVQSPSVEGGVTGGAVEGFTGDEAGGITGGAVEGITVTCPRCGGQGEQRFYGPCDGCRAELRAAYQPEGRVIEVAEYEPKVNVTANAVATKDD